ncbi:putative major intrinsic protein [Rosa chinensis]|uniref:Putative major intrinsic protein n=1 Tax=Rosa chinensis TaxID=74649 RepID=A0A2P6PJD3_ROSCH|nr:putative major intrinsic protein [Rosa chinensis]
MESIIVPHEADHKLPRAVGSGTENRSVETNSLRQRFLASIGAHEYFSPEMWRAALTEFVATACLMFTLTSSIISCLDSHEVDPKLLISTLCGVITLARASIYILMQCVGSIVGFLIIKTVMDHNTSQKYSLGGCTTHGVGTQTALMLEFVCTFVVLFVGVTVAFDKKRCKELGLAMVCLVVAGAMALAVFVSITVTGKSGNAGVGLNPARCLGPALLQGGILWDGHWVFWVGSILACSVYYCFSLNLPKEGLPL